MSKNCTPKILMIVMMTVLMPKVSASVMPSNAELMAALQRRQQRVANSNPCVDLATSRQQRPAVVPTVAPETYECITCFGDYSSDEMASLGAGCRRHLQRSKAGACLGCMEGYLQETVKEKLVSDITCPCPGCPEKVTAEYLQGCQYECAGTILDRYNREQQIYADAKTKRINRRALKAQCASTGEIMASCECSNAWIVPAGTTSFECTQCSTQWTNESAEGGKVCRAPENPEMVRAGCRRCPGCEATCMKADGCNALVCKSYGCETSFCYLCGMQTGDREAMHAHFHQEILPSGQRNPCYKATF